MRELRDELERLQAECSANERTQAELCDQLDAVTAERDALQDEVAHLRERAALDAQVHERLLGQLSGAAAAPAPQPQRGPPWMTLAGFGTVVAFLAMLWLTR